jgi:ADP-ribosyl-[dinitrogen reductase] hydrolase
MDPLKREVEGRVIGSLLGLAVCDAVGTTVESMPPGSFDLVQDMVGGGKFNLLAGQVLASTSVLDAVICLWCCAVDR